ncbi:MAG: hypothetical protein GKS00_01845 [Alphaproteobacteria bacterium]|nr:hypothetical protein [Alphaproteobacteria bacterium]
MRLLLLSLPVPATILLLVAALFSLPLSGNGALAEPLADPATVPGYRGADPPETGYRDGRMYDDAESRALRGQGPDGEAARTVIESFTGRPDLGVDGREAWYGNARRGEDRPQDFFSIMKEHYGNCTGGTVTPGAPGEAYVHACQAPATKSRHACRAVLAPVCADVNRSCMTLVRTNTGIMPFRYDGTRYMYIGKRARDSIPDRGIPTREHNYTAELQFDVSLKDVSRFVLDRLEYEDFVEVTFNGVPVFTDLDRRQYRKPHACGGCHVINRPVSRSLGFDLLPYLREGLNSFRVRLNAVAHGNLWLRLDTDSRCCKDWRDRWRETCR